MDILQKFAIQATIYKEVELLRPENRVQRIASTNLSKAIIKKIGHSSFAPSQFEHNEQLVHELKAAVSLVSRLPLEVASDTKIGTVQHNLIQYVDLDTS